MECLQIRSGTLPKMPKLQSMRRHGSGMPRMEPAIRARGMTPAQATRPKVTTHLLRTGSMYGPDKGNSDDDVSKCEPVGSVRKEWIVRICSGQGYVDTFDPREQTGGFGHRLQ